MGSDLWCFRRRRRLRFVTEVPLELGVPVGLVLSFVSLFRFGPLRLFGLLDLSTNELLFLIHLGFPLSRKVGNVTGETFTNETPIFGTYGG